ncbi:hypothetical protein AVEN_136213-1 [Araneus ventricosus]|uniref:Uncharacterized protein n=1 Tax=Araneus ventricosus TaxID=182803 RepID=A0A4Y2W5D2_ARAVE|nr:hypothetical protein AVEN_136213-1 [Araneus ventricosus]
MAHFPESWSDSLPLIFLGIRTSFELDLATSSVELVADLVKASHVFLRIDRVRKPLEPPYAGPYKVLSKTEKIFTVEIDGKPTTVSIDRLKTAYLFSDEVAFKITPPVPACKAQKSEIVTRYGRRSS